MALLDPGFQTVFGVALSTNVGISHDESGMTMDILFKPRIKATQRNSWHKTGHFAIQESTKAQNRV